MRAEGASAVTCLPRSSVSIHLQKDVDVLLKELKPCARHLRATLGSYVDELRILDRLYYKNVNQHRAALFFKRVSETRRYGQRLVTLNIAEHVDYLYASFFGLTTTLGVNQKLFKGTWTHAPMGCGLSFVVERISTSRKLIDKMCNQLMRAYQHFTLAMRSGAFIQLIVLFSAICSRMYTLLSELSQLLRNSSRICDRLLIILDVGVTFVLVSCALINYQPGHRSWQGVSADPQNEHVICNTLPPCDANLVTSTSTADLPLSISHLAEDAPDGNVRDSPTELNVLPMLDIQTFQHPAQCATSGDAQDTDVTMARGDVPVGSGSTSAAGRRHKAKKVKKKRDEIDEIFSF